MKRLEKDNKDVNIVRSVLLFKYVRKVSTLAKTEINCIFGLHAAALMGVMMRAIHPNKFLA